MPWHLGGEERLTYYEVEAYLMDIKRKNDAERKAANDAKRKR